MFECYMINKITSNWNLEGCWKLSKIWEIYKILLKSYEKSKSFYKFMVLWAEMPKSITNLTIYYHVRRFKFIKIKFIEHTSILTISDSSFSSDRLAYKINKTQTPSPK